jgi:hypothetical protein
VAVRVSASLSGDDGVGSQGGSVSEQSSLEYVLAAARELYARTVYSHKIHEKERELWSKKSCLMSYINVALVSLTTLFAIVAAALPAKLMLILTAVFAATSTAFVLWQANFDPVGRENLHRTAAKELLWIREQLLLLIVRCHDGAERLADLNRSLGSLSQQQATVNKFSPGTSQEAYTLARTALKQAEEFTFTDEEIDRFLPGPLRTKSE